MTEQIDVLSVGGDAAAVAAALEAESDALAVRATATAAAAVAAIEDDRPDCVVATDDPPEADGLALLERVREVDSDVPCLLYATRDSAALAREAAALGEVAYVNASGEAAPVALAQRIESAVTARRTEAGLQQREAHYRALVASASDVIVTIDETSTVTSVNDAVSDVFGYEPEELIGAPLSTLMSDELGERHREAFDRYLATGERTLDWESIELPGRHRDGHEVPIGVSFGEFEHRGERFFTGIIRDITDRKGTEDALRRERNLTDRIVHTSPVGITVVDEDGEISFANDRAERLLAPAREGASESGRSREPATTSRSAAPSDSTATSEATAPSGSAWNVASFEIVDPDGEPLPDAELPYRRVTETGEPVFDVELGLSRPDGGVTWLSVNCAPLPRTNGGGCEVILAFTDVTERVELAAERRATLERVTDAFFALDTDWNFTYLNDRANELINPEGGELVGRNIWEEFEAAIDSPFEEAYRRAMADQETVSVEAYYPEPLDAWFEATAYPSESGLSVYFRDVTERRRREKQLASLNEVSRELTECETEAQVCEAAVDAARERLDLPLTAIALYDGANGRLRPAARTPGVVDLVDENPLFASDRGLPWRVFVEQERTVSADLRAEADADAAETPLRSAIVLPLGEHGVFVTGSTDADAFSETDVHLASILAGNTVSALHRADRERTLRDRTDALAERNETLERLGRINGIIRTITGDLIRASTRDEALAAVCDRLADAEPYRLAWVGSRDRSTGTLSVDAASGDEDGYLEAIGVADGGAVVEGEPTERAAATGETVVNHGLATDPPFEPWRRAALDRGYQACIAVPLTYQGTGYGVLGLYAAEADTFAEMEVEVFTELGETISYALNAIERRRALLSQESVELEFRIRDEADPVLDFVDEADCEFEFENVVPGRGGQLRVFFSIRGAPPERVLAFGETAGLEAISLVTERDDESLFSCRLPESAFFSSLVNRGAMPLSITAADGEGRFVVRVPRSADIATFVGLFEAQYDDVELVARRSVDEPVRTRGELESAFETRLTERQAEVLETAYASGFFEWPRETTAEELGEALGVSQPTVSRHIRAGERKLFGLLFGDE